MASSRTVHPTSGGYPRRGYLHPDLRRVSGWHRCDGPSHRRGVPQRGWQPCQCRADKARRVVEANST
eukprot:6469933-Alexandrium_andersonii.AAC.1